MRGRLPQTPEDAGQLFGGVQSRGASPGTGGHTILSTPTSSQGTLVTAFLSSSASPPVNRGP